MNYSANSCESSENENRDTPQQQIIEMGSTVVKNKRGTIHCLTIIGQVEGHTTLPPNVKTTKYEHVLPLLTSVEEKDDVDGLLLLLNTVGGDIEAGLGIAELVAGMTKPTATLVLGGGHSIGVPLAVCGKETFIASSASMTVWYTASNTSCSRANFTCVFAGWTLTSTAVTGSVTSSTQPGKRPLRSWLR